MLIQWISILYYCTAGIAGCMSALKLFEAGVTDIVMLEAGVDAGDGVKTAMTVADPQFLSPLDQDDRPRCLVFLRNP